ncbi:MAG: peptide chain release factor H [Eubacteriales bacterium]|nr:peptide chain release factor H [Eubacteriales bacterium]
MIVQISAGQGPEECRLAVGKLFEAWKEEFPGIEQISCREGRRKGCFHSILFTTKQDMSGLEGTVCWVCRSPLRPEHKRKNWYVDVSIIPEKENTISGKDYRIESFHSGGKGGQHINKVETGIRVIHVPTGITVSCTEERSQYANKQKALKRMQGILAAMEQEAEARQTNQAWREHTRIVRGNPVRVYEGMEFRIKRGDYNANFLCVY